jgi:hypothetical protein
MLCSDTLHLIISLVFLRNGTEELIVRRKFFFGIETIAEIDSSDTTVSVNLNAESFDIIGTIGTTSEIGKIELNLIPTFIETHGHCADEGLDACCGLIVGGTEATADILII